MLWRLVPAATRAVVQPLKSTRLLSLINTASRNPSLVKDLKPFASSPKRLLSYQQDLPLYPVPPLQQTLDKFLHSVQPLLSQKDLQHAERLVKQFSEKDGQGQKLQQLLEEKAKGTINWLEEWWLNVAYLEYRLPSAIHVNPGITAPRRNFNSTDDQIRYAARMISALLEYKVMIDDQTLPIEKLGGQPLCMKQYYHILGCCRIPGPKRDATVLYPGDHGNAPKHITIVHNNHFFAVDVYGKDQRPLNVDQIYSQLQSVMEQSQETGVPVGILTTEHRDTWAQAYSALTKSKTNRDHLENIHSSIALLCLDKRMPCSSPDEADTVASNQMNHGGGSSANGANRYFDKILQIIIGEEGNIGFNYEHSTAEGPPIIHLADFIISRSDKEVPPSPEASAFRNPLRLDFEMPNEVSVALDAAAKSFDAVVADLNLISFKFEEFGKGFIKSQKISPDAFIQISFQLAYYKMYGHSVATYESGSLRKYRHGRTETIRSCTPASHAFCQAMTDGTKTAAEKAAALRVAIQAHRKYTDDVVSGNGIDRHLLGLKLIAKEHGLDVPELLTDDVYNSSVNWQMSTSQVASKTGGLLCFAPVVPNGYGLCYNPMEDKLLFSISSWNSCQETDANKFAKSLEESFKESQSVLLQAGSKL